MLDAGLSFNWCDVFANQVFAGVHPPVKQMALVPEMVGVAQTVDGKHVTISFTQVQQFAAAFDRPEMLTRDWARAQLPTERIVAIREAMVATIAQYTAEHVLRCYQEYDMAGSLVLDEHETLSMPQVVHNQTIQTIQTDYLGEMRVALPAPIMHGTPLQVTGSPPLYGEHTDEILKELGLSSIQIASLYADGAVRKGGHRAKSKL